MSEPIGRREASKQATREALATAAKRLFAERGYEATTVRDIAAAGNVTERTFYRYFDGKEGLLAGEFQSWLAILKAAILARPVDEPPFTAVQRAMMSIGEGAAGSGPVPPIWLFGQGSSLQSLRRTAPRPLLRLEGSICDAILARTGADDSDADEQFRAQVIARASVGALRSAIIRLRELRARGQTDSPDLQQLVEQAFAIIADSASAPRR